MITATGLDIFFPPASPATPFPPQPSPAPGSALNPQGGWSPRAGVGGERAESGGPDTSLPGARGSRAAVGSSLKKFFGVRAAERAPSRRVAGEAGSGPKGVQEVK